MHKPPFCNFVMGGYKTKTEDPKTKIPSKSSWNRLKIDQTWFKPEAEAGNDDILRFSTNLARVFVLYKTPPKVQNEDPLQSRLEILRRQQEHDSRPKQKRGTIIFVVFNEFGQGLRFVKKTPPIVQNEDSLKIALKSVLENRKKYCSLLHRLKLLVRLVTTASCNSP